MLTAELISNVVIAVLAFAGTIFGSFLAHNKTMALIAYRLEQLETKVGQHNNLEARVIKLESDIRNIKEHIDDLKDDIK